MKVLYIANGYPDYLCDLVMHGLYNLLGDDLTHSCDYYLMYKDKVTKETLKNIYGRGFTVWGNLPKYLNDNSDLEKKIINKYFDYIIYGSIHRCQDYLNLVKEHYSKKNICFLDGEDFIDIWSGYNNDYLYFKRELTFYSKNILPISFSIPIEKIVKNKENIKKIKKLADLIPGSPLNRNYIYENEEDYYRGYREAYFGMTFKKAGWDCMRHYEILANYCLPYFPDLNDCPKYTMVNFPKEDVLKAKDLYESSIFDLDNYYEILEKVFEYTKQKLVTTECAKYVLSNLIGINK
jgi:hypothetical protein